MEVEATGVMEVEATGVMEVVGGGERGHGGGGERGLGGGGDRGHGGGDGRGYGVEQQERGGCLSILWEPPSPDDLRGHQAVGAAPGGDPGEGGARQEKGEPAGG